MERSDYKGYIIEARPQQLVDDGRWTMDVNIERHDGERVNLRGYSADNSFETRDDAIRHCINFGRQIIDGEVAGFVAP
jgi:hypothetical protein